MIEGSLLVDDLGSSSHRVTITANSSVGVVVAAFAGCLAFKHLAVLCDSMAFALRDVVLSSNGVALRRGPCEIVTANLNVIVGELAELVVVHTKKLSLLGCA